MGSRRNERAAELSGTIRRGPLPIDPLPPPSLLEQKFASQSAEIERLSGDNHKLAASHISLRQNLIAAQREGEKIREHIRSIQTEGDIQIRILLEKIANMEANIRARENIKKEFQEAHIEAQGLVEKRVELNEQIKRAAKELESAQDDLKKLPEMRSELDGLRKEHQRLRKTFEHEKGLNIEKVEQMKIMEKDLIGMAGEVERLRARVVNAEKANVHPPYSGPYMNSDYVYPPPFHGNGGYVDSFGRPSHLHMVGVGGEGINPYATTGFAAYPPVPTGGAPAVIGSGGPAVIGGGGPAWNGMYDPSHIQR